MQNHRQTPWFYKLSSHLIDSVRAEQEKLIRFFLKTTHRCFIRSSPSCIKDTKISSAFYNPVLYLRVDTLKAEKSYYCFLSCMIFIADWKTIFLCHCSSLVLIFGIIKTGISILCQSTFLQKTKSSAATRHPRLQRAYWATIVLISKQKLGQSFKKCSNPVLYKKPQWSHGHNSVPFPVYTAVVLLTGSPSTKAALQNRCTCNFCN